MNAHLFGAIWGSGVLPIGLALLVAWCLPALRRQRKQRERVATAVQEELVALASLKSHGIRINLGNPFAHTPSWPRPREGAADPAAGLYHDEAFEDSQR